MKQKSQRNKTFTIIYGFAEGLRTAGKLINALEEAGYILSNIKQADVIIAHSGGCYVVPRNNETSTIMLVGLSNWPEINLLRTIAKRMYTEKLTVSKLVWGIYYALAHPYNNLKMLNTKNFSKFEQTLIIRNHDDIYFPRHRALELKENNYNLIELPGLHDDLWDNPKPYVNILNLYAKQ